MSDSFENLLGTSARLTVVGIDERTARTAIDAAVAEISRLDQVLSTYREDSEINKLNRDRSAKRISADLRAVIEKCISWQAKAKSHFSCKLGRVVQMWQQAGQEQVVPARPEVRALARQIRRLEITMGSGTDEPAVMLPDPILLNVSGLAKGYIIDRAFSVLRKQAANANAVKVEIGGDGRYWSDADPWQVALSTDANGVDNPASTVSIQDGAIAASGHRDRGIKIGRRTFSHILQTRDGWPMHNAPNTVVTAPTAVGAGAPAPAISPQCPPPGGAWGGRHNRHEARRAVGCGPSKAPRG
ncbi:MAG: FAD:protein FMN transferase, partial [Pseudomonadota bacterium]